MEKSQSKYPVLPPRFESGTSKMEVKKSIASAIFVDSNRNPQIVLVRLLTQY